MHSFGRSLVASLLEVIGNFLNNGSSSTGLEGLLVNTNNNSLVGLHGDNPSSSLLALDRRGISLHSEVFHSGSNNSICLSTTRVLEVVSKGLAFSSRDDESERCSPEAAIKTENSSLLDLLLGKGIDMRHPQHFG